MAPADLIVLAILAIAALRGLFLGLVREVISLAALALACVAVRYLSGPAGDWLHQRAGDAIVPLLAQVIAGVGIAVGVLVVGAIVARVARSGARAVGLAWLDRSAGGLLGAAEGALVAAVLLALVALFIGREHPFVAESRAFATLERVERLARGSPQGPPPVAAPGERRRL